MIAERLSSAGILEAFTTKHSQDLVETERVRHSETKINKTNQKENNMRAPYDLQSQYWALAEQEVLYRNSKSFFLS